MRAIAYSEACNQYFNRNYRQVNRYFENRLNKIYVNIEINMEAIDMDNAKYCSEIPISQRIHHLRRERGLTQKAFADSLGIVQGYLSGIERGNNSFLYSVAGNPSRVRS